MFFLAALFSKESALLFPVILVCYEFFYACTRLADLRSLSLRIAPFLTVLGVYLFARISALGGFAPHPQPERTPISALETLFAIPPLFARYVGKLLIPTGMNYFYAFPLTTKFNAWAAAGLLSALLLLAAIFYFRNKQPLLSFAICWFILTLAPAFSINSLGVNFFTERYLYIPSVGFSILAASLALAIYSGVQASSLRLAFRVALAALFVFYVAQTERRVAIFHDNFTLLSDTVRSSPHSYAAQGQLGFAYDERGEVDHALEHVLLALQINPAYEVGQINAAWYLTEKGDYDAAILHLKEAIRLHPDYLLPWINLAKVYSLQHDWQHARETLEQAATLNPGKSAHFLQLAAMAASNEKAGAAFADLQSAVDRAPDDFAAWVRLGDATGQAGQWSRAANAFQHAAKLQPANVLVLDKWGISLERAGDSAQAVEILQRAVQLRSDSLLIRQALAGALAADNRLADSSTQLRKILHLNPAWEHADQVHLALAVNLEKSGDRTGAMQEYQRALALNPSLDFASKRLAALAAQK
jgi:tetratricopeptide (TPR) repeat protein